MWHLDLLCCNIVINFVPCHLNLTQFFKHPSLKQYFWHGHLPKILCSERECKEFDQFWGSLPILLYQSFQFLSSSDPDVSLAGLPILMYYFIMCYCLQQYAPNILILLINLHLFSHFALPLVLFCFFKKENLTFYVFLDSTH